MKIWKGIALGICALFLSVGSIARGAGVTIITHGYNANVEGWVTGMANQIPNYANFPGTNYSTYKLTITFNGINFFYQWSLLQGSSPTATDSGEIIVKLDWSQVAGGFSAPYNESTFDVGSVVGWVLQQTNSLFGGHSPAEFPIHLIGHSRGGSLVSEISSQLGTDGVWVDHLTTLDPHPLNNDGFNDFPIFVIDAPARTYANVLFHDNYWQNLGDGSFVPDGEPVFGAYIRQLYNLSGGYSSSHSDVHLWYHGTVDERNPGNDTEALITSAEFNTWYVPYENFSYNAGFRYSLIGRGNRTSTDQPVGAGFPAIRDGYNQAWDLGAGQNGNRTSLPSNNGTWPNVIKFNLLSTNIAPQGTNILVKYFYQWAQSSGSTANLSFYLDDDLNPLNANSRLLFQTNVPGSGASFVNYGPLNLALNSTNAPIGYHTLYAKIIGGGKTRYLYAPEILNVTLSPDTTPPAIVITNPPSARTYTNAQTVILSAAATDNVGVTSVEFYDATTLKGTDLIAPYTFDWPFTGAENGAHIWTARAYDAAGNVSTSSAITLTVSIDITPPTVAIAVPTNGQVLTTSPFTVTGTAADFGAPTSGISIVEVRVNGGSWSNATGTTSWTRSIALLPCPNTIEARSLDKAGNYSIIASNSVVYVPPNTIPNRPTNVSPASGLTGVSLTPMLQSTAFSDPDCIGDTHAASQWQVLNSAGTVIVADSGTDIVSKVTWIVPTNKLYYGSNYQWRVRFQDNRNGWSSNSTQTTFATIGPLLNETKQGTNFVLKWPTNASGFTLQLNTNLATTNWTTVTPDPVIVSGQYTVTNKFTNQFKFYRLKR